MNLADIAAELRLQAHRLEVVEPTGWNGESVAGRLFAVAGVIRRLAVELEDMSEHYEQEGRRCLARYRALSPRP